ncbi:lactate dehydrogenase [Romboutsia weinsteinii]|uniref:Lactate dehydrogenase n=1 Tax=Romboutsia weinsteinii TaxID=2020949 RepID=A0A371J5R3_9FIRM|nr:YgjV family protein [Romboutsia weinsteinii]RDY28054.1 lactate dehydrogenase [Romboutsia weinsteinii]
MFSVNPIEWIGYLASILIVISLTMSNIKKLRIINSLGCLAFVIYGVAVKAYPVAISNFAIVIINLYYLYKLKNSNN